MAIRIICDNCGRDITGNGWHTPQGQPKYWEISTDKMIALPSKAELVLRISVDTAQDLCLDCTKIAVGLSTPRKYL